MSTNIVTGKKYHILTDLTNKVWSIISFWTKASDVEFNDGKSAETKLGIINGITSDINCEDETIAASAVMVNEQINNCFQSVSNGKSLLASAITGKGVTTDASASFATMANNIKKIKNGATALSGSKSIWVSEAYKVVSEIVTFSTPFNAAPSINYSVKFQTSSSTYPSSQDSVKITDKTAAGFTITTTGKNEKYGTYIVEWNAAA